MTTLTGVAGFALVVICLVSCTTVGPDFRRPKDKSPAQWHSRLPEGVTPDPVDVELLAQWWTKFNDPTLTSLVQGTIQNNLNLQKALSTVRQARAQLAISQASLFPKADFSGTATHTTTRTKTKSSGIDDASGGVEVSHTDLNNYSTAFDASWEVDVFGGTRRSVEAHRRDFEAQKAAYNDALVSLAAEVANGYVTARTYQRRIELAEANLRLQKETLNLAEFKFKSELISELPVEQARYAYENAAAQIPVLHSGLDQSLNVLATLLGQAPGTVHERLGEHHSIPTVSSSFAVGVPSEALRRRPDVRKAEKELAAQTARVGVAVADLYPKFYLTGSASRQGEGTSGYRRYATETWSLGPRVIWNLLNAGSTRQKVNVQSEIQQQYLLSYQSTILSALEEVENKLYAIGQQHLRKERLEAAAKAARNSVDMSRAQYQIGQVDFLDVISAEQSLVTSEDDLAQSQSEIASNLISLFKAIGGGWDESRSIDKADVERN